MGVLKGLLWFCFAVGMIAVAMYLTGNYELADRLAALFVVLQPYLPLQVDVDLFLVVVTVISLLVASLALVGCAAMLLLTGSRLGLARQQALAAQAAAAREIGHIKDQQEQQYQRLQAVGQGFTKRLDKGQLIQALVQSASRITSGAHANGVVSLWLLQFGTEVLRFELGLYCDEALFTQAEFPLSEPGFARVITSRKPWVLERWEPHLTMVRREKAIAQGLPAGALVVPLVIEEAVLGALIILCHPDVLKGYQTQQSFYDAIWQELSLGLAIAIQGELAIFDRLTGTYNREYFLKRLIQEVDRASRFQFPLSVLMIDVDNFKAVNDTLGHPQGDAVLKIISKLLRHEVRAIDLVGRYGGEEFVVLLPETGLGDEAASASGALVVAERIRRAVDDEFRGLQKPLNLTVSVGVAVRRFPEDRALDHRELIRVADEQLYRAKTTGKNKVCVAQAQPAGQARAA